MVEPTMNCITRAYCLATLIPPLFLIACGAPAGLEQATTEFAEAASKNEQALKDLDQAASERLTRIRRDQAIAKKIGEQRALVRGESDADCTFDGTRCHLTLKTSPAEAGVPLTITSLIPNQLVIAQNITEYAGSLQQIAAADETDKVRKAANSALGSVCGLAGTLAIINPAAAAAKPACDTFSVPVVSLVTFLYGEYQTQLKLSALRKATREMQPILKQVPVVFAKSVELATEGFVRQMVNTYNTAKTNWEDKPNDQTLTGLLTAADNLNGVLETRAAARSGSFAFNEFVSAHEALTNALTNEPSNMSSALAAISQLVDKANQLADIAAKFSASAKAVGVTTGQGRNNP
jgi:hypothetical protein